MTKVELVGLSTTACKQLMSSPFNRQAVLATYAETDRCGHREKISCW